MCLTPDDARSHANAFERGAPYTRLARAEVLPAAGYPRPVSDDDVWFEAVDAWGRRQPSWQEATTGTSGPSGVGVVHCHVVLFGITPSHEPQYVFLAAEDAEALAPLVRHQADEAAEMADAMQLVTSMTAGMPSIFPGRDQVGQLLASKPWPPA